MATLSSGDTLSLNNLALDNSTKVGTVAGSVHQYQCHFNVVLVTKWFTYVVENNRKRGFIMLVVDLIKSKKKETLIGQ